MIRLLMNNHLIKYLILNHSSIELDEDSIDSIVINIKRKVSLAFYISIFKNLIKVNIYIHN